MRLAAACLLGAAAAWGSAARAAPASLCGAGERVLFSCAVGHKVVSVCAAGGGGATYLYGSPGKVELSSQALSFAEHGYSGGGETQISLRNGAYSYVVYDKTTRTSFGPDGHGDPDFTSGLLVLKDGKTVSSKACATDATIAAEASRVIKAGDFVEH